MADTIDLASLDPAGPLTGTEVIPIVQAGVTVRTTSTQLADQLGIPAAASAAQAQMYAETAQSAVLAAVGDIEDQVDDLVEDSLAGAVASATSQSSTHAANALAASNTANTAADRAEDARDAAQAAVGVDYVDEAAALAGASNGDRFTYWDGDTIVLAKKEGGVIVPITGPYFQSDKISHNGQNLSAYLNLLGTNFESYGVTDAAPGDMNAAIVAMKADGYRYAKLPLGTLTPTANLDFTDFELVGQGPGASIIDLVELTSGFSVLVNGRSKFEGASIVGPLPDFDINTPFFTTIGQVVALTGMGSLHGVRTSGPLSHVDWLEITGIPGAAYAPDINNVGEANLGPMSGVQWIRARKNYAGLYLPSSPGLSMPAGYGAEYLTLPNIVTDLNHIGVIVQGGNNILTNCHDDHNHVGVLLLDGHNNSHGSWTGGTINHSKFATIIAYKIANGFLFNGLNIWDGGTNGIYLDRSQGVAFEGGIIEATKLQSRGGYGTTAGQKGINVYDGVKFVNQGSANVIRNIDAASIDPDTGVVYGKDNVRMINCHHMKGDVINEGNVGLVTRWDRAYINDDPIYGERRTINGADSVISMTPMDAQTFLGSGAVVGAPKIRLPFAFGNTMFRARIQVTHRTTGRDLIDVDVSGYALGGATWNSTRYTARGHRPAVRFGSEVVGATSYPVIYLGELADSWTDCLIRVSKVSVYSSLLGQLQYVASGWSVGVEATAFSGLTASETRLGNNTTGDVDTVREPCKITCASTATNIPVAAAGELDSIMPSVGATSGVHIYRTFAGAFYSRVLTAGVFGSWRPLFNDGSITATAANIADVANAINTTGKFIGKLVWDSTNNRMMRARAALAASPWDVIDGSVSVTPA